VTTSHLECPFKETDPDVRDLLYTAINHVLEVRESSSFTLITINVPLFKKLRDIIFFWWDNHFMSHFEGHFEGAKTFLTP
jgi:hypothetical protein